MEQVIPCNAVAYLSLTVLGHQWKYMKEKHYGVLIYVKEYCLTESDQTADTICYSIFCHYKVDYILYIYKFHFFTA